MNAATAAPDEQASSTEILIVDDEEDVRRVVSRTLQAAGFEPATAKDGSEALDLVQNHRFRLIFLDLNMPGPNGLETLKSVGQLDPNASVVMMTGYPTVETAVEAMKAGAKEFLLKPIKAAKVIELARKIAGRPAQGEPRRRPAAAGLETKKQRLITRDAAMRSTMELIDRAAAVPSTVLIEGESGTGKELVAHEIHDRSARSGRRFVAFNCAVIPEHLLESELFGYERGAFTGASTRKIGYFEAAQGGTIFLDEIGEMSADLQAKLLRVIQEHSFQRLGSTEEIATDARIIAATNRNLEAEIAAGRFRKDLYYRLNVIKIVIPPLRDRPEDILFLSSHFVERFSVEFDKHVAGIDREVAERFLAHRWEGNVRELRNVIERAMAVTTGVTIAASDLPEEIRRRAPRQAPPTTVSPYQDAKSRFEEEYLTQVMEEAQGNIALASRLAAISRQHFYEKLARYKIDQERFRHSERGGVA